ncbi:hypothetical protein ACB098_09G074300 [Castanea mollissima]
MDGKNKEALKEIERLTAKADEVQENILKEILSQNGATEYLINVPVVTYKAIRPYIQRIANGEDSSLITSHPITEMIMRSYTLSHEFLIFWQGHVYFVKKEISTPCGLPARTAISRLLKSKHFKRLAQDPSNDNNTSPYQALLCSDISQSMYCQILASLIYRHQVQRLGGAFASVLLQVISVLERNWVRFCNDIRTGQLDPIITDLECVHPCAMEGNFCQLWPRAKFIEAAITGSMAQYIPALEYYSDGKLPLVSNMHTSSECFFGVNLKPLCDPSDVAYTLLPNMGEEDEVRNDKLVDLVQVRLGYYYELVVTTFAVIGFYNRAPQFRYICRRDVILSVEDDKINEEDLQKSINVAQKLLEPCSALLMDYTSYVDASTMPGGLGHYVLYWEIRFHESSKADDQLANIAALDDKVLQECCITMEEELDYTYRICRTHNKSVGPLEIRVVEPGTQYKTPRCIRSEGALKLLNSHVKLSFFSPREPK